MARTGDPGKTVLNRLAASGYDTEKKVQALATDDLLYIAEELELKISELKIVREFQKAIKERRVWAYYNSGIDREVSEYDGTGEQTEGDRGDGELRGTEGVYRDDDGQYAGQY